MEEQNTLRHNISLSGRTMVLIAFSMAVIFSGGFYGLDHFNRLRHAEGEFFYEVSHLFYNPVPISAEWVWIYFCYFPLCFSPLLFKKVYRDPEVFIRVAFGFFIQFFIAFLFFYFLPTRMIRPDLTMNSLSARVLAWLYEVDKGFNAFPSLHVANTFFVAALIGRIKGKVWGIALLFITTIVSASTIIVGQHCFPDVIAGIVLGVLSFKIAFSQPMIQVLSKNGPSYIWCQLMSPWN